jgi:type III secretion protein U
MNDKADKQLPPTEQRLRRLRRDGQIPIAKETRAAASTIAVVVVLWNVAGELHDGVLSAMKRSLEWDGAASWRSQLHEAFLLIAPATAKVTFAALAVYVAVAVVESRGIVLNLERLKPNIDHLNPVEGIRNKFGLDALTELIRNLLKFVLAGASAVVIVAITAQDMVWAPTCGAACELANFLHQLQLFSIPLVAILFVSGLADLKISRLLFAHSNRMSHSDLKRERRDIHGAPEIKSEQHAFAREIAEAPTIGGVKAATVVIWNLEGAVALSFDPQVMQPPYIQAVSKAPSGKDLVDAARALKVPVVFDVEAAEALSPIPVGEPIPSVHFAVVARCLNNRG